MNLLVGATTFGFPKFFSVNELMNARRADSSLSMLGRSCSSEEKVFLVVDIQGIDGVKPLSTVICLAQDRNSFILIMTHIKARAILLCEPA